MATHRLSIPLGEDDVRSLRIGDMVYLDGKVPHRTSAGLPARAGGWSRTTARFGPGEQRADARCPSRSRGRTRRVPPLVHPGDRELPLLEVLCATTSSASASVVIIGKGGRDKWVYEDVFARTGTVFLTTVGYGIAALYGRAVKCVIDVHWKEELGLPEAMWVLEVENFGLFIVDGDLHRRQPRRTRYRQDQPELCPRVRQAARLRVQADRRDRLFARERGHRGQARAQVTRVR